MATQYRSHGEQFGGRPPPAPGRITPTTHLGIPYVGIYTTALVIDTEISSGVARLIAMGGVGALCDSKPCALTRAAKFIMGLYLVILLQTGALMQLSAKVLDLEKDRAEIFGILHSRSVREFAAFGGRICSAQVGLTIGKQSAIFCSKTRGTAKITSSLPIPTL